MAISVLSIMGTTISPSPISASLATVGLQTARIEIWRVA